jgi:hypothetical protein
MVQLKAGAFVSRLVSVALIGMGFMQFAAAGPIGTEYIVDTETREASMERVKGLLGSDELRTQFEALGVAPDKVATRIEGLSTAELLTLEGKLDQQLAGGGALGTIGAVFLVLLILELVGVTDIFKAI